MLDVNITLPLTLSRVLCWVALRCRLYLPSGSQTEVSNSLNGRTTYTWPIYIGLRGADRRVGCSADHKMSGAESIARARVHPAMVTTVRAIDPPVPRAASSVAREAALLLPHGAQI